MTRLQSEVEVDPIQLLEAVADLNDWLYTKDSGSEVSTVQVPGHYSPYVVCVRWFQQSKMLMIRVSIPVLKIPDYQVDEMCHLVNLINQQAIYGSWFVDFSQGKTNHLIWRQEIHSDIESITEEKLERSLSHCATACDNFYPAVQMFLTAKPRFRGSGPDARLVCLGLYAREAMEYVDAIRPVGTA